MFHKINELKSWEVRALLDSSKLVKVTLIENIVDDKVCYSAMICYVNEDDNSIATSVVSVKKELYRQLFVYVNAIKQSVSQRKLIENQFIY